MTADDRSERTGPERASGALPADDRVPEHSGGTPLDESQPSAPRKPDLQSEESRSTGADERSDRGGIGMPVNRAYVEAVLEGVMLPATRNDLIAYARSNGGDGALTALGRLPSRRYSTIDEVGEQLQPVQPQWSRTDRLPRPASDLPPGGPEYGVRR